MLKEGKRFSFTLAVVPLIKMLIMSMTFVMNVIITRQLGAEGFGLYTICTSIVVILVGVFGNSLDIGVLRFVPEAARNNIERRLLLLRDAFYLKIGIGLVLLFLCLPFASFISQVLIQDSSASNLIILALFGVFATLLLGFFSVYFQAGQDFRNYLILDFIHMGGKLALVLVLVYMGMLTVELSFAAYAVMPLAAAIVGLFLVNLEFLKTRGASWDTLGSLVNYSKWLILSSVFAVIYTKLDILLLNTFRGSHETGIYAAAFNLALIPQMVASILSVVFYPKIVPWCQDGCFRGVLGKFTMVMLPISLVFTCVTLLFSEWVIVLIYGEQYRESVALFQILVPGYIFWLIVFPVAAPLLAMNNPRLLVLIDLLTLVGVALGLVVLIPLFGAIGAAITILISKLLLGGFVLLWAFRNASAIEADYQKRATKEPREGVAHV